MPTAAVSHPALEPVDHWPAGGLTRVPYWVFQREDIYAREQASIFRGPVWSFLCLDVEVRDPGDFRTSSIGDTPVVITRDEDGTLHAFENRCAHRGALICLEEQGKGHRDFQCVYHGWTYDLKGNLTGVAFRRGVKGKGGMPGTFRLEDHHPRKVRVAVVHGLVFGTFSEQAPALEDYLGSEFLPRIERVFAGRKPVVLARYTQVLPNNWKLYVENVKDSYHASILHLFFTTFELNQLSYKGGVIVSPGGGHHISYNQIDRAAAMTRDYGAEKLRSDSKYRLADPSLLAGFDEFPDGITLQILSVFPTFVLQQIQNSVAVRRVVPRGAGKTDLHWTYIGFESDTPEQRMVRLKQSNLVGPAGFISMEDGCVGGFVQRGIAGAGDHNAVLEMGGSTAESSDSRVNEASVRGFWKQYRTTMGL
ncbi:MAG: Rieske 2Fe-2S domain-containing protein [Hyphomicrobiaceae bacterium]